MGDIVNNNQAIEVIDWNGIPCLIIPKHSPRAPLALHSNAPFLQLYNKPIKVTYVWDERVKLMVKLVGGESN